MIKDLLAPIFFCIGFILFGLVLCFKIDKSVLKNSFSTEFKVVEIKQSDKWKYGLEPVGKGNRAVYYLWVNENLHWAVGDTIKLNK